MESQKMTRKWNKWLLRQNEQLLSNQPTLMCMYTWATQPQTRTAPFCSPRQLFAFFIIYLLFIIIYYLFYYLLKSWAALKTNNKQLNLQSSRHTLPSSSGRARRSVADSSHFKTQRWNINWKLTKHLKMLNKIIKKDTKGNQKRSEDKKATVSCRGKKSSLCGNGPQTVGCICCSSSLCINSNIWTSN